MYVARNILDGHNADWPFQMAPGRAANIQKVVYRMSGGVLSTLPGNASTVSEPSPGNYVLNVTSAGMAAGQSGDMYFATMSDGDQFVRLQAWTYDNPEHFEKVLADIADLDADLVGVSAHLTTEIGNAKSAIQGDISAQTTTLQGDISAQTTTLQGDISATEAQLQSDITAAKNSLSTDIGNAKSAIQGDISAQTTTLQGDITAAKNAIQGDIAQVKADTAAILLDTNELQSDWTDGGRLDLILDASAADALSAKNKAANIETSLGNLQGLQFTVGGVLTNQNDLAGALGTIYDAVDDVEGDIAQAVVDINAQTVASQGVVTGAITAAEGNIMGRIGAPKDGVSISDDLANVEAQLQSDITAAKNHLDQEITNAEVLLGNAISTSEGVVTGAITAQTTQLQSDISAAQTAIVAEVNANEALIGTASDTKVDATVFGKIADVKADVADLDADVVALQGDVTAEIAAQGAFRTATTATLGTLQTEADALSRFSKLESDIANVDGDVAALQADVTQEIADAGAERASQAAERTAQGNFRTSTTADLASIEGKVDLLETEADAAARYTSVSNGQTNIMNRLGTPTAGSTVSGDIAAIKALLDSTLTNARLLPFVPSSILSPLQVTRLRFTCHVVDGETGALEAPDNGELGVSVHLTDLSGGGSSNVSGSALFDASSAGSALSAAPGGANRIPNSFYLMNQVSGRVGAFEAYLEIPAYTHGNYEFEFACFDSDPSGTPTSFSRSSFMEVRKNVGFSSAGAF